MEEKAKEYVGGDELREVRVGVGGPYKGSIEHVPAHFFLGFGVYYILVKLKFRALHYSMNKNFEFPQVKPHKVNDINYNLTNNDTNGVKNDVTYGEYELTEEQK